VTLLNFFLDGGEVEVGVGLFGVGVAGKSKCGRTGSGALEKGSSVHGRGG